jgi:WD40 repeat protein
LVSSGNDRQVLLWDVAQARLEAVLAVHDHAIDAVAFAHSGQWVATAGFEDKLCILDLTGDRAKRDLHGPCRDIRAIAISRDDRHVVVAGRDGMIRVWDVRAERLVREVAAHTQRVRALTFAQEDSQVISGGEDGVVRIWNWHTDDPGATLPRQPAKVMALVMCGPRVLATAGSDNAIRLWDLATRRELASLTGHTGSVAALAYQDGILASGGFDTYLRLWQVPELIDEGVRSAVRVR